jgi:predicted ribosome quality control (RQC) complex YloA/Tae2 family protein
MNDEESFEEKIQEQVDGLEERLDELDKKIEETEDNDLRKQLIELCLKGSGSEPITKEMLLNAIGNKPL